jgi:hypothetical protein
VDRLVSDSASLVPLALHKVIDGPIIPKIIDQCLEILIDIVVAKDCGTLPNHLLESNAADLSCQARVERGQSLCEYEWGHVVLLFF